LDVHIYVCHGFRAVPAVVRAGVCVGKGLDFLARAGSTERGAETRQQA